MGLLFKLKGNAYKLISPVPGRKLALAKPSYAEKHPPVHSGKYKEDKG